MLSLEYRDMHPADSSAHAPAMSRRLTAYSFVGLTGRLRCLLSGMALAEATDRQFCMYWPRTTHCGASFHDLFSNEWPVVAVDAADVASHRRRSFAATDPIPDLRTSSDVHLHVTSGTWMVPMRESGTPGPLARRCGELFDRLQPTEEIHGLVHDFVRRSFRPTMVGVHVRRGDFVSVYPNIVDSIDRTTAAVDRYLEDAPSAGVLLCTDDGAELPQGAVAPQYGVAAHFGRRYGDRLVRYSPRSLNRAEPIAVIDSLVELLLLRRTHWFVGTGASGYSDFVAFRRATPSVLVDHGTGSHGVSRPGKWPRGIDMLMRRLFSGGGR